MSASAQTATSRGVATTPPPEGISRGLVLMLAGATGATVANMYYSQPLLHTLGRAFHVSTGTSGLLVTISQIGYVLGLALLVPLGDLVERRALITNSMLCIALAQAVACAAPGLDLFAGALLVVGVGTCAAQVIVPMSSIWARPISASRFVAPSAASWSLNSSLRPTVGA